jgi:mannose-6-phosphate isomerase-like protein (cupin superfamily)
LEGVPDNAVQVMRFQDVEWTPLNPARGDKSPQAANLWGDRAEDVSTGFMVKFVDGFSSPPHIHNVTYRGVVIAGLAHNDDPGAADMWMPAGSFWTQPAGEVHITSAKGQTNIAYIEIDSGPYLVAPPDQAFDNGERPVNVHKDNLVWVDQPDGVAFAYLWGDPDEPKPYGLMGKLPKDFKGTFQTKEPNARVIVISGMLTVTPDADAAPIVLEPGSYIAASTVSESGHIETDSETVLYVRASAPFALVKR